MIFGRDKKMRFLLFLFIIVLGIDFLISLVDVAFTHLIINILSFKIGLLPILIGLSSLIILSGDLFLYSYVFRTIIFKRSFERSLVKPLIKSLFTASMPIIILVAPDLLIGLGGVLAEDLFIYPIAYVMYIWNFILGLYILIIHPFYAPFSALAIAMCVDEPSSSLSCVYKMMRENVDLIFDIIVTSIAVLIITLGLSTAIIMTAPLLNNTLIPIAYPPPQAVWSSKWTEALDRMMPRYYHLIIGPFQYILYAYIFNKISYRKIAGYYGYV
jgi:hypothetical protein